MAADAGTPPAERAWEDVERFLDLPSLRGEEAGARGRSILGCWEIRAQRAPEPDPRGCQLGSQAGDWGTRQRAGVSHCNPLTRDRVHVRESVLGKQTTA